MLIAIGSSVYTVRCLAATPAARTLEVLAPYEENDRATFARVLDAFTKRTGVHIEYTQCCTRARPELETRIAEGNPPDVAVVVRPTDLPSLAHAGDLVPLSDLGLTSANMRRNFGAGLLRLAKVGARLVAVPLKASSKSMVWYKPRSFRRYGFRVPRTWRDLVAISRGYKARGLVPWAVGCGPGRREAWTLTDWFENVYLRTAGPVRYERLFAGRLRFTDNSVARALRVMLQIVNRQFVLGWARRACRTSFLDALTSVFGRAPRAELYMEGGFIGTIALGQLNTSLRPGVTIDSMPWPTIDGRFSNETIGGVDFAVAVRNSGATRKLMRFLASPAAGRVWASAGKVLGSSSVSPNRRVPRSLYANVLVGNEAHQVANADRFVLDGSDQLPGELGETWGSALQRIVTTPASLRPVLARFEHAAKRAFAASR